MLTREKESLSPEFEERARFYRDTCGIDVRDYIYETDENLQLDVASLRHDLLTSVLGTYDRNAPGIVADDAVRSELIRNCCGNEDVADVPLVVFNRTEINSIVGGGGRRHPDLD